MASSFRKLGLVAAGLVLLAAGQASAFAISMVARNATTSLQVSDTVTVDIFFDATEIGIRIFSMSVLVSDASVLHYDPALSAALPIIHPAPPPGSYTTGAQPGYILYDPAGAMGVPPAVALYPQQTPAFLTWPAPPPGQEQVKINYAVGNIVSPYQTRTTGTGIWIASLVFHIDGPVTSETLGLSMSSAGDVLELGYQEIFVPAEEISLSAPIVLTGLVPEPTTGVLIGLGALWLVLLRSRRSASAALHRNL